MSRKKTSSQPVSKGSVVIIITIIIIIIIRRNAKRGLNEREEIYLITTFETSMAIEAARWQFDSRGELATGAKKKEKKSSPGVGGCGGGGIALCP